MVLEEEEEGEGSAAGGGGVKPDALRRLYNKQSSSGHGENNDADTTRA